MGISLSGSNLMSFAVISGKSISGSLIKPFLVEVVAPKPQSSKGNLMKSASYTTLGSTLVNLFCCGDISFTGGCFLLGKHLIKAKITAIRIKQVAITTIAVTKEVVLSGSIFLGTITVMSVLSVKSRFMSSVRPLVSLLANSTK